MKCLQQKSPLTPLSTAPGVRTGVSLTSSTFQKTTKTCCSMMILSVCFLSGTHYSLSPSNFILAAHINQTLRIHYSGSFLSWHRYYVWIYEKPLREECGYTGYQPYREWSKYIAAPQDNPMFDGSSTSLSGNGVFIPIAATSFSLPRALPRSPSSGA